VATVALGWGSLSTGRYGLALGYRVPCTVEPGSFESLNHSIGVGMLGFFCFLGNHSLARRLVPVMTVSCFLRFDVPCLPY